MPIKCLSKFLSSFVVRYHYVLFPDVVAGALCGQLRGKADSLQPPPDGHLRAADAADGSAAVGGDGEQSKGC